MIESVETTEEGLPLHFWPTEHVYFVATKKGKVSVKKGIPLVFLSYEEAYAKKGDGHVCAASTLRLTRLS